MDNTEMIKNEAVDEIVTEGSEKVVDSISNRNFKGIAVIGGAMVAGALAYKFAIKPAAEAIKNKIEKRRNDKDPEGGIIDAEFEEVENDYEEE